MFLTVGYCWLHIINHPSATKGARLTKTGHKETTKDMVIDSGVMWNDIDIGYITL